MEQVILANMCMVYNEKNEVVVQDRLKSFKGISFPGGHIENGESIVDSVIREVYEETGLTISNLKLQGVKNWFNEKENHRYMVFMYKTNTYQGDLKSSDEGICKWMNIEDVLNQNLAFEDMSDMITLLTNEELSELFYKEETKNNWVKALK